MGQVRASGGVCLRVHLPTGGPVGHDRHVMTACRGARTPTPGGMSMNPLRRHKHAILLAALIVVALIESFSHRQVLGPGLSDLVIVTLLLLVFLIVLNRRVNRLVAFLAWVAVVVA